MQVRDQIRDLVQDLRIGVGEQLPTENEISVRFDVGRTTVREAFKLLEQDGFVHARRGIGRFVAAAMPTLQRPINRLESVTEMLRSQGYEVTNRVLGVEQGLATKIEQQELALPPSGEVTRLERLRLQGDYPLIYSIDVLSSDLLSMTDGAALGGSLLGHLEEHGIHVASATAQVQAVVLKRDLAARLGVPPREPWLLLTHINLSEEGRPVIFSHDYYRGDKLSFHVLRRRQD